MTTPPHTPLSRQNLYELVWDRPTRTVAAELGISDVALAKACKRAQIPIPPRGYWARKPADQKPLKTRLPARFPGASDQISFGKCQYGYWPRFSNQELLDMPAPPVPTFDESIESVTARVENMVGPVKSVKNFDRALGDIAKLLSHDEERRRNQWSYDKPKYDSGVQRRRLLILNAIFLALHSLGCRASLRTSRYEADDPQHRSVSATIGAQHVYFLLESPKFDPNQRRIDTEDHRLKLTLGSYRSADSAEKFWIDADEKRIESQLREVIVSLIVKAEEQHRESALRLREWLIERKQTLIKELERQKAEQEQLERERRAREEKAKIDSLLRQADNLQKAMTIRAYVRVIRDRVQQEASGTTKIDEWAAWALGIADSIDPALDLNNLSPGGPSTPASGPPGCRLPL